VSTYANWWLFDSVKWEKAFNPNTLYLQTQMYNQGTQLKYTSQYASQSKDTLFVDCIFSRCYGPTSGYVWANTINLDTTIVNSIYNLVLHIGFDSNTTNVNCHIIPLPDIDTFYFGNNIIASIGSVEKDYQYSIYPNPVNNILYLDEKNVKINKVKILSAAGNLVLEEKQKTKLDVSMLAKGIYFLQIESDKGMQYAKFIKE
jgi:hypothetical protein